LSSVFPLASHPRSLQVDVEQVRKIGNGSAGMVGSIEGDRVGKCVGSGVGTEVGTRVGAGVGEGVGKMVDGACVGSAEGGEVQCWASAQHRTWTPRLAADGGT